MSKLENQQTGGRSGKKQGGFETLCAGPPDMGT
jgi:hypothetical protein